MTTKNPPPPLYGLVLAGGRSRRMGRDKAALAYRDGVPHARRTAELLNEVCDRVFVSRRADQPAADPSLAGFESIPDAFDVGGPLNGILSALAAHPDAAFLVAACDLPFLDAAALKTLVAGRDPAKPLTAFANPARDGALEPLCAIYEPAYAEQARTVMGFGLTCPTKIADALDAQVLTLGDAGEARFLMNANTPEDYERATGGNVSSSGGRWEAGGGRKQEQPDYGNFPAVETSIRRPEQPGADPETPASRLPPPDTVAVEYFAVFRAQAKRSSEEVPIEGVSLAALYDSLRGRHGFALERASVHVAVNDAWASWDAVPRPGDRVVFIPPVSGG